MATAKCQGDGIDPILGASIATKTVFGAEIGYNIMIGRIGVYEPKQLTF